MNVMMTLEIVEPVSQALLDCNVLIVPMILNLSMITATTMMRDKMSTVEKSVLRVGNSWTNTTGDVQL